MSTVALAKVCELVMGQAPASESYNDDRNGLPLIAGASDFGKITPRPSRFTTEATKTSRAGDIVICVRATIGDLNWSDDVYCLGRGVAAIRVNQTIADPRYVWWALDQNKNLLCSRGRGATFKQVNRADLETLPIPLPPLDEQRRLAAILDRADALRRMRREAISRTRALAETIFHHAQISADDCAHPVSLKVVADIQVGHPFQSEGYTEEVSSIRLCRGTNVLPGRVDWSDLARWPSKDAEKYSFVALCADDILIAMDRPWISEGFKISRVTLSDLPSLLVQRVARIRASDSETALFLYYLLRGPDFTRHCRPTETTVPHISPKEIRSYKFTLPPRPQLASLARRLRKAEAAEQLQSSQLAKLEALFAALQHRAFNGELTAKVAERELAGAGKGEP